MLCEERSWPTTNPLDLLAANAFKLLHPQLEEGEPSSEVLERKQKSRCLHRIAKSTPGKLHECPLLVLGRGWQSTLGERACLEMKREGDKKMWRTEKSSRLDMAG